MSELPYGYDPVATFNEITGDVYIMAEEIAKELGDDFEVISVIHGDIYLCEVIYDEDTEPYWYLRAEVSEGKTGSWDSATDEASQSFPEHLEIVDGLDGHERYIVSEK